MSQSTNIAQSPQTAVRQPVMLDSEWAQAVADRAGLGDDVERVAEVLAETGVNAGTSPAARHTLRVSAVYFAGLKNVADDPAEPTHIEVRPFAFHHVFVDGMTAFATDGVNSAGKSTILGVLLWALRGEVVGGTISGDLQRDWLREAAVTFTVDGATLLVQWRIDNGRATGKICTVTHAGDADLEGLAKAGLSLGEEVVASSTDARLGGTQEAEVSWPGEQLVEDGVRTGRFQLLAEFVGDVQFKATMSAVFMPRLGLEPIKVWTKNRGAVDEHDAKVVPHGWAVLSQAFSIIDPDKPAVLGEVPNEVNQLLAVFLGSRWSQTVVTARWQLGRLRAQASGIRRRATTDDDARSSIKTALTERLESARAEIAGLLGVPSHQEVADAARAATRDALILTRAESTRLECERIERTSRVLLREGQADLHALTEAVATRRFWHSVRPSCCPRCDRQIEDAEWGREQEGQCSLCASPLVDLALVPAAEDSDVGELADELDEEDRIDDLATVRAQVEELEARVSRSRVALEQSVQSVQAASAAAAASAAELERLEHAASPRRRELELQIAALEGRLDERSAMREASADGDAELGELDATIRVLEAAEALALRARNAEHNQVLERVSEVITRLGVEFNVRHLVSARLDAGGRLPVVKGSTPHNFGRLPPGERLRLRAALIVGLLEVGAATGTGRHPGLLIIDNLTGHEITRSDAAAMAHRLSRVPGLQLITASTYGPVLVDAIGSHGEVVTPPEGHPFMF